MGARLQLEVSEPFKVSCEKVAKGTSRHINPEDVKAFWETDADHYATKRGCYVFALRAAKGYTPWYVGKTNEQNFKNECFGSHQLGKFNYALFNHKGAPVIFFVAPSGTKNILPKDVVEELEKYLIQQGFYENRHILNTANAKEPEWGIKGVLRSNKGKPNWIAQAFVTMMGI